MRPPAGGVNGELSRGVGERSKWWHGTQREEAAGLMPCSAGKKEQGGVFYVHRQIEGWRHDAMCVFLFSEMMLCVVLCLLLSVYTHNSIQK
jgi:hypothetical protein